MCFHFVQQVGVAWRHPMWGPSDPPAPAPQHPGLAPPSGPTRHRPGAGPVLLGPARDRPCPGLAPGPTRNRPGLAGPALPVQNLLLGCPGVRCGQAPSSNMCWWVLRAFRCRSTLRPPRPRHAHRQHLGERGRRGEVTMAAIKHCQPSRIFHVPNYMFDAHH
jgi:hypothetical protein